MDHERFRLVLARLTAKREVAAVLSDPPEGAASLELGDDERRCPHCTLAGLCRGAKRAACAVSGARSAGRRSAHGHGAVRAAPQGAVLRRLACRGRDAGFCAEHGASLAPPLSQRCARRRTGLRDCRGGRDLLQTEAEPQAAQARRQGPKARPFARAGAAGRRRSRRRDPRHTLPALNADSVKEVLDCAAGLRDLPRSS